MPNTLPDRLRLVAAEHDVILGPGEVAASIPAVTRVRQRRASACGEATGQRFHGILSENQGFPCCVIEFGYGRLKG
jgi:hypothetical protein